MSDHPRCYLHGVMPEPVSNGVPPLSGMGPEHAPLEMVESGELAALVSVTPLSSYAPSREHLLNHDRIAEECMKCGTFLPAGFGQVFPDLEELRQFLSSNEATLMEALREIEGKEEFALQAFWDVASCFGELEERFPRIKALRETLAHLVEKRVRPMEKLALGQQVAEAMACLANEHTETILSRLRSPGWECATRSPEGDRMFLNAFCLVHRGKEEAFREKLVELDATFEGRFTFQYGGPFPPYHFASVEGRP